MVILGVAIVEFMCLFQICIIEFLIMFSLCAIVFYDQARLASQTGLLLIYNLVPVIKCAYCDTFLMALHSLTSEGLG